MAVNEKNAREKQEDEIIERTSPAGEVVCEAVYAEGEHELERNSMELALSALVSVGALAFWKCVGSYAQSK